jgi:IclR family transcriptional regulator, pca regulon regulatory protein
MSTGRPGRACDTVVPAMAPPRKLSRRSPVVPTTPRRLNPKDGKSSVQSLAKGLRLLEAFSSGAAEMTLSEIAAAADLDAGTTFRMLNTLVEVGYVVRVPDSRRFRLSLKVLDLGFHAIARTELRALVRPLLQSLVDQVNEAASFAVLDGGDVLYVERVRAHLTRLGVDIRVGTTIHAPISLVGRVILAYLPENQFERALATAPRHPTPGVPVPERTALDAILARIRTDGYLIGSSIIAADLRVLAVPVIGPDGWATGAVSVAAPVVHCTEEELKARALAAMRSVARQIASAHRVATS